MKKKYRLRIVCAIAAIAVGIFVGLSLVQSAPASKPAQWTAIIDPVSPNLKALPDQNRVYVNGQDGVTIRTGSSSCGNGNNKTFSTYISFQIALPEQIQFSLGGLLAGGILISGAECQFPENNEFWPGCLFTFLNKPQPYAGYQFLNFFFSTAGCEEKISADFTKMAVGTWLKMNFSMALRWDSLECLSCDGANSVDLRAHGHIHNGEYLPDIYVFRDSESEWTIRVATEFDNPDFQTYPPLLTLRDLIRVFYCECVEKTGRGGRTYYEKQYSDAAWAKTPVAFQIKFIKTQ